MKKILIVDDDADIRAAMHAVLDSLYEVREADGAARALELVKQFTPNLAILDVMMDADDAGFELARTLRTLPDLGTMKILMFTSIDREKGIDFKSTAGDETWLPVDGYVSKPLRPREMVQSIRDLIG